MVGVVEAAGNYGAIGITFQEFDDDLVPDARQLHGAPAEAGDALRDADPAGAIVIVFADAVPVELYFDAAVFVGIDFFALGAGDEGGLRTVNKGTGSDSCRAKGGLRGNGFEAVAVRLAGVALIFGVEASLHTFEIDGGEEEGTFLIVAETVVHAEGVTGSETLTVTLAHDGVNASFLFFHADTGELFAVADGIEAAGVIVLFEFRTGDAGNAGHAIDEMKFGILKLEIALGPFGGMDFESAGPIAHGAFRGIEADGECGFPSNFGL